MPRRTRPSRPAPAPHRRRRIEPTTATAASASTVARDVADAPTPAPAPAAPVTPPTTTRITTTDYGYVVGELRRIALLTTIIIAMLLILWAVFGSSL